MFLMAIYDIVQVLDGKQNFMPGSSFPQLFATPFWTYEGIFRFYMKVVKLHRNACNIWSNFSPSHHYLFVVASCAAMS